MTFAPAPELTGPYVASETSAVEVVTASAGRCRLLGEIARGGMGAVFKARDPDLGRDLAVKVLLERHRGRPELVRRFLEEARVAGRLQHPGVAPVHDVGRLADERPFFAMKLVEGRTLEELLRRRQSPREDTPRFLKVFEQVCQTVAYAHAQGIVHRDLKPLNIMVGAFGEVQVMDWGLAKVIGAAEGAAAPVGGGARAEATGAGRVLGTPSYMAPEQARGEADRLDARCDVFGLGAILCMILTGRPPYFGADSREVLARAARGELADAYARLDGCGAEAELVGLAKSWLSSDPADRPADAGAAAEAMTGYLAGVQERLRRAELAKAAAQTKAEEERKRRGMTMVLAATILLAVAGAGAGALWYQHDQAVRAADHARRAADTERDVTAALDEASALGRQAEAVKADPTKWAAALTEALSAVKRAQGVLTAGLDDSGRLKDRVAALREALDAADRDRRMVAALEGARFQLAFAEKEGAFNRAEAAALYAAAFRQDDKDWDSLATEDAGRRINRRAIRKEMLTALDDWALFAPNKGEAERVRGIVRAADPDPTSFRNRCQALITARDWDGLRRLADGPEAGAAPAASLDRLAGIMLVNGGAAEALQVLKEANERRPGDFWIAFDLASASLRTKPPAADEAIRYFTAALMLRPGSAGVHMNLGVALRDAGRVDEAIAQYHKAIELKPDDATSHYNLAVALRDKGRSDEAMAEDQKAVGFKPDIADAHYNLGAILFEEGRLDDAIGELHKAIELKPDDAKAHTNLGLALNRKHRLDDAMAEYHKAIELRPDIADAHYDLGLSLRDKGRSDEAMAEDQKAVGFKPDIADAHYNLAAILFEEGRLDDAIGELHKAIELKPEYAEAQCNLGHVLRVQGRFAESLSAFRRGDQLASLDPAWHYPSQQWVRHAEQLVRLDALLPALLRGEANPSSPAIGLEIAAVCHYKRLNAAEARFCIGSFAADPTLAADPNSGARYHAASASALAGCGQGDDAKQLDDKERARWRKQALDWLKADLAAQTGRIASGFPDVKAAAMKTLSHWREARDLAGARDADALAKLPAEEQEGWRKLWADVDALLRKADNVK